MEITDKESHDLQNRLDTIMDMLKPPKIITKSLIDIVLDMLENVRDDLPCSCGEEDIDADREMQRERNFDRIQQSIETGGTDY